MYIFPVICFKMFYCKLLYFVYLLMAIPGSRDRKDREEKYYDGDCKSGGFTHSEYREKMQQVGQNTLLNFIN